MIESIAIPLFSSILIIGLIAVAIGYIYPQWDSLCKQTKSSEDTSEQGEFNNNTSPTFHQSTPSKTPPPLSPTYLPTAYDESTYAEGEIHFASHQSPRQEFHFG